MPLNRRFLPTMKQEIDEQIRAIEAQYSVRVLFACESGSRAWGFASPDSDYDVRFIYSQPKESYLSIRERRDVIELPVNEVLDVNGWDIRKALQLFLKSNGPLYEWLQSPIIYKEQTNFAQELRKVMLDYFSPRAGCHHYLSMTRNTFEYDLQGEQVKLKRYFYALRPALACRWILERKTVPPMEFHRLRTLVSDPAWQDAVDDLLKRKIQAEEKALIAPVAFLQQWLAHVVTESKAEADALTVQTNETDQLDKLFRKYIGA
jgi:uncharacterized protein